MYKTRSYPIVCHQMECTLLLLVVEQVLRSMNAFPQCEALQVWGCKVIAHVTTASGECVCVCVRGVGLQGDSPCDYCIR